MSCFVMLTFNINLSLLFPSTKSKFGCFNFAISIITLIIVIVIFIWFIKILNLVCMKTTKSNNKLKVKPSVSNTDNNNQIDNN